MIRLYRYKYFLGIIALSIGMTGCAHSIMRGSVAMKVSESEAHVCLNKGEVKVGDKVELYSNICTSSKARGEFPCNKVSKGHGMVMEIINEHYSLVKFDQGVKFMEGDFIERHTANH